MRRDLALPALVIDPALHASVDTRHGHPIDLVEMSDRLRVLSLPVLHDELLDSVVGIHPQTGLSTVRAGIANQPREAVLSAGGFTEEFIAEVNDISLVGIAMPRRPGLVYDGRYRPRRGDRTGADSASSDPSDCVGLLVAEDPRGTLRMVGVLPT